MTTARAIVPAARVQRAVQRACACGKPAKDGEECVECRKKQAPSLRRLTAPGTGLAADFSTTATSGRGGVPSVSNAFPRLLVNEPGDAFEREADAMADAVLRGRPVAGALPAPARLQREEAGIIPAGPLDLGDTSAARNRKLPERRPGTPHGTSEVPDPAPEPCLRGARCQLAIAGSNMDFADAARAAESKSQEELKQKGESVEPRPAPFMTDFLTTAAAPAAVWLREILVDPSMGAEGGAGAWQGPCPDDAQASCVTVSAGFEEEAREFKEKPDAEQIGGQPCAEWRFMTRQMMFHEAAHARFRRAAPAGTPAFTGFRDRSTLSHKELSELFAQLSEFPVFYGEYMTGDDPVPEKLRRLRDDYGARYLVQGQEISQNIPGIVMRLRCLNPCAEVDAMLRSNFATASTGWPPAVRQALLTLLTDPAYGINWPAPRQPTWSLRPEPEGLRFGSNQLQRDAAGPQAAPAEAPPVVHDVLRSSGAPLDAAARAELEPRFGHDFSGVRVHTDERAAASARAVNATAYTVGRDVVFGRGTYAPDTAAGRRLLAHELAHVVQQRGRIFPVPAGLRRQEKKVNPCAGQENDPQSFTWSAGRQYIRDELGADLVSSMTSCRCGAGMLGGWTCVAEFDSGVAVEVDWIEDPWGGRGAVFVEEVTHSSSGRQPTGRICSYNYDCPDPGTLKLTKRECFRRSGPKRGAPKSVPLPESQPRPDDDLPPPEPRQPGDFPVPQGDEVPV